MSQATVTVSIAVFLISIGLIVTLVAVWRKPTESFVVKPKYMQTVGLHYVWLLVIIGLAIIFTMFFTRF